MRGDPRTGVGTGRGLAPRGVQEGPAPPRGGVSLRPLPIRRESLHKKGFRPSASRAQKKGGEGKAAEGDGFRGNPSPSKKKVTFNFLPSLFSAFPLIFSYSPLSAFGSLKKTLSGTERRLTPLGFCLDVFSPSRWRYNDLQKNETLSVLLYITNGLPRGFRRPCGVRRPTRSPTLTPPLQALDPEALATQ